MRRRAVHAVEVGSLGESREWQGDSGMKGHVGRSRQQMGEVEYLGRKGA